MGSVSPSLSRARPLLELAPPGDPRGGAAVGGEPDRRRRLRPQAWSGALFIAGGLALAVSLAMSVTLGAADLGLGEVLQSLSWRLGLSESGLTRLEEAVIWQMRAPRALLAAAVGAGLAVCGAVLQGLTRNALADPYLLGVSSGASTGAVAVLVLGVGGGVFALSLGALVGAVGAFAVVLALIGRRDASPARVILAGVAVSQFFAAVTSLVLMSSADNDNAKSLLGWLLGSLASANWVSLTAATAAVAIGGTVCWARASALDAFVFGRETAASLGVSPDRAAFRLFALTAMVTAVLVAASGAIGFVGLVVPHASRLLGARRHRLLLPASALIGALFLVWADVVSRVAFVPQQIPVGVVTALIGVPAFAAILRARMGRS